MDPGGAQGSRRPVLVRRTLAPLPAWESACHGASGGAHHQATNLHAGRPQNARSIAMLHRAIWVGLRWHVHRPH
eukprot:8146875-Alexandrium_andersonii.AAC.1